MKKNIGSVDRIGRVILGVVGLSLVFVGPKTMWGYLGLIPLITAGLSFCPLYPILGISTCSIDKEQK